MNDRDNRNETFEAELIPPGRSTMNERRSKMNAKDKLEIRTDTPWALWWGTDPLPFGATVLGTVTHTFGGDCDLVATGALLRLSSGIYCQGNAGALRSLPQREVEASLASLRAAE